eukprot:TRINITY_DN467_c12_g1_i1.p2 TRINITY_DN467_c12_g1~~TRINITY_DN467_c12_g1_i1.p2  ORF type:complete len:112 (+),score=2.54 TRINITY_DN467_c12_g1_i1:132-467(+)
MIFSSPTNSESAQGVRFSPSSSKPLYPTPHPPPIPISTQRPNHKSVTLRVNAGGAPNASEKSAALCLLPPPHPAFSFSLSAGAEDEPVGHTRDVGHLPLDSSAVKNLGNKK